VDVDLSCHHQERSRRSESKIEFHDLLLSDLVSLLLGNAGFTFGTVHTVRNSVLIDNLSWSNALLAVRISESPVDLERTSALVGGSCISDES